VPRGVDPHKFFVRHDPFLVISRFAIQGDDVIRPHIVNSEAAAEELMDVYEYMGGDAVGMPLPDIFNLMREHNGARVLRCAVRKNPDGSDSP